MREETRMNIAGDNGSRTAPVDSLLRQMAVARAAELARGGLYREAEKILAAFDKDADSAPEMLDLLARINAQEGRLDEAERLWARACQLDSANKSYQDGMRRAAELQRRPGRRTALLFPLIIIFGLSALFFGAFRLFNRTDSKQQDNTKAETPVVTQPSPEPSKTPEVFQPQINVAGVKTKSENTSNALIITFDEGIFAQGTILKPDARRKLAELGFQLKSYAEPFKIEIAGVTDNIPMPPNSNYKDNAALGIERARIVYDYLHKIAGLEARMFTLANYSEPQSPNENDSPINRSRNRTAILRITARQK